MPVHKDLSNQLTDQIARNHINHGRYLLVAYRKDNPEPQVFSRGLEQLDLNNVEQAVEEHRRAFTR